MKTFLLEKNPVKDEIDDIRKKFIDFWDPYFEGNFALDFSNVERIDKKGIAFLLFAIEKAESRGAEIVLLNLSADLKKTFQFIGLAKKLQIGNSQRIVDL